jgi:hypothetical protein
MTGWAAFSGLSTYEGLEIVEAAIVSRPYAASEIELRLLTERDSLYPGPRASPRLFMKDSRPEIESDGALEQWRGHLPRHTIMIISVLGNLSGAVGERRTRVGGFHWISVALIVRFGRIAVCLCFGSE